MAYYKVRLEVWCDWDPGESDLEEIVQHVGLGEDAICTLRTVVRVRGLKSADWEGVTRPLPCQF